MPASEQTDTALFLKNERPNEYEARFKVEGEVRVTIKAESLEDAQSKAEAMMDEKDFGRELDDTHYVDIDHVWKSVPMFLVTRDGTTMQVSRLAEGDMPREADERGF